MKWDTVNLWVGGFRELWEDRSRIKVIHIWISRHLCLSACQLVRSHVVIWRGFHVKPQQRATGLYIFHPDSWNLWPAVAPKKPAVSVNGHGLSPARLCIRRGNFPTLLFAQFMPGLIVWNWFVLRQGCHFCLDYKSAALTAEPISQMWLNIRRARAGVHGMYSLTGTKPPGCAIYQFRVRVKGSFITGLHSSTAD